MSKHKVCWFFVLMRNMPYTFQERIQGGGHSAPAPPKIGKNMIFWRKVVIFHTKYPNNFRASLRSPQIFLSAPSNLKSWIRPCICILKIVRLLELLTIVRFSNNWHNYKELRMLRHILGQYKKTRKMNNTNSTNKIGCEPRCLRKVSNSRFL
jgi:hypothetical protein